jgi:hypothetical protein
LLARAFLAIKRDGAAAENDLPIEEVEVSPRSGPTPLLLRFRTVSDQARFVAAECERLFASGIRPEDILVIYHRKVWNGTSYVQPLLDEFRSRWVPGVWISEDSDTKTRFARRGPNVAIITAHSAKGLDAKVAFVLGPVDPEGTSTHEDPFGLYYVAMTRAQERLYFCYVEPHPVVDQVLAAAGSIRTDEQSKEGDSLLRLAMARYPLRGSLVEEISALSDTAILERLGKAKASPTRDELLAVIRAEVDRHINGVRHAEAVSLVQKLPAAD